MGGIGKTQLAVEYNFKYEKEYGCRFWVAAENPTSLRESYNQIAAQLFDVQPIPQEVVGKVRDWLESTSEDFPCNVTFMLADATRIPLASHP